jgi:hypothetical protein
MGMNLVDLHDALIKRRTISIWDDFTWYVTAHNWTTVVSDSGTVAVGDAAGGIIVLTPSDGTVADNDEAYLKSTNEVFLIANNKPLLAEARVQFTEANTDDANIFFGVADAIGANTLVDDGAGMKTSFSGAAIYKVDGGTVWKCISSKSTTQTISTSLTTAGGATPQTLRIEIRPVTSTVAEVTFWVDGVQLRESTSRGEAPIKHQLTYTSATEMQVGAGVKNGFTNLETLNIDYVAVEALR